jgi:arabinogalactan oligomer/maltooligosaccharide transport system substrate-binding protein
MKRFLLILFAAMLISACSDIGAEAPLPSVSVDPDEPVLTRRDVELTVWTDPGAGVEFIDRAAEVFNRRWPNITINAVGVEPGDIVSRVWAESARGGCADLFIAPHMEIRQLAEALLILPARDQTKTRADVFASCAQTVTVGGVLYGYPVTADTVALFYNKRLVDEASLPSSWEEMTAFIRGFGEEGRYGFVLSPLSAHSAAPFLSARNNRPFGPNGDIPMALNLESSEAQEGMNLLKELGRLSGLKSEELTDAEALFAAGRAAFCITGSWSIARFVEAGVDFGVTGLPSLTGSEAGLASLAFTRVMLVSAYSELPDEASAFAAFLLTEEMQKLRIELTGELPSVDIALPPPHYSAGFVSQLRFAYGAPTIPETERYWAAFTAAAARIWDGADIGAELSSAAAGLRAPTPSPDDGE